MPRPSRFRSKEEDVNEISIPYRYEPRPYQLPFLKSMDRGTKRAVIVWHRRAGKDKTAFNMMIGKMLDRVGAYYYFFPEFALGRRILWEGMGKDGMRYLEHFPEALIKRKNETDMTIELKNGSIFQIIGTDKFDKKVIGTNVIGCVYSEFPLQDPNAWNYVRPILKENGGWAVFAFTPRGKENHGWDILQTAQRNNMNNRWIPEDEKWFSEILTIKETGVLTEQDIEGERREGTPEEIIQQEYYCSFNSMNVGTYYSKEISAAAERITVVPVENDLPVDTFWDLGIGDSTAIWFAQRVGNEYHLIDYLENSGEGLNYYIKELHSKGYVYGSHFAPHDIQVRELSTGLTRKDIAKNLGVNFRVVKNLPIDEGINLARSIFNKCWFDEKKCKRGIECLSNYKKDFDDRNKVYKSYPKHDWSSHGADSFRYFAVAMSSKEKSERSMQYQRPFYDQNIRIWRGK